ncbi:lipocalin family protein [Roseivirga pacifica]|uniref:lipocalin family protein n=1 Tax=Roseivirga pacifica TaxID=1267423 RepID=UPI003BB0D3CF
MKKLVLMLCLIGFGYAANGQTATELLGKWQLVKWVDKGKEKDIQKTYKTDQVYQVFQEDSKFQSIIGDKVKDGKWSLNKDNSKLTIKSGLISVKFKIEYFDEEKRVISSSLVGTLEYKKVEN